MLLVDTFSQMRQSLHLNSESFRFLSVVFVVVQGYWWNATNPVGPGHSQQSRGVRAKYANACSQLLYACCSWGHLQEITLDLGLVLSKLLLDGNCGAPDASDILFSHLFFSTR